MVSSKSTTSNSQVGKYSTTATTTTTSDTNLRPWYRNGGMIINLIGIVINLIVPLVVMCRVPDDAMKTHEQSVLFLRVLVAAWIVAFLTTTRSKTTYCIFVVPTYFVSFICLPMILQNEPSAEVSSVTPTTSLYTWYNVTRILFLSCVVASWKINICMSVCMHRYASHAAFKCGRWTNIGICILGCLANQGGPLWWASQHRCHHKLRITYRIYLLFV
jgi:fatty-acid desaturase